MQIKEYEIQEYNMKYPFKLIRGFYNYKVSPLRKKSEHTSGTVKCNTIETKIITDGSIYEKKIVSDKKLMTKAEKSVFSYAHRVDRVVSEEISFLDANYLIRVLVAKKFMNNGHNTGLFDTIENIDIYVNNTKDKQILEQIRLIIEKINRLNIEDITCLFDLVPKIDNSLDLDIYEIEDDIFQVKTLTNKKYFD